MNSDVRASLIASGAAAVVSAIVGALSGVSFLALALRALLGGLVFGGLVFGALALARRFLSELFEGGASPGAPEAEAPPLGGSVNIVLPAEGPLPASGDAEIDYASGVQAEGGDAEELASLPGASETPPRPAPRPASAPAPRAAARAAAPSDDDGDYDFTGGSFVEDAEPVQETAESVLPAGPGAGPGAGANGKTRPRSVGLDELDVLPDLESLSESFVSTPAYHEAGAAPGREDEDRGYASRSSKGGGGDSDPAVLAQAVRTLLKRDQKG
ncbi:MAG: hypothetical protein JNG85_02470 [Spirochaetaceae bacterium]|nr:hypothetical protein [Spirochaetaceae bacterium]